VNETKTTIKIVLGGILGVLVLILFLSTYFTVAQYERGVVTRFGRVVEIADPGLHFKTPFVNSVTFYRTDILTIAPHDAVNTYTIDNQEVDVIFSIFYRIPPDKISYVFQNVQDYQSRLLNMVVDRLKSEMGKINVQHVAEQRGVIRDRIKDVLAKDARELGVEVSDFLLTNLEYSKGFRTAVEAAAQAKATVETREQERIQAERVAAKRKIEAEGEANAVKAKADGDAYAMLKNATAQAEALRIQNAALAQNRDVLELRRIEVEMVKAGKWNGTLPSSIYAGAPIPFMQVK
jgi:prohibitin 2